MAMGESRNFHGAMGNPNNRNLFVGNVSYILVYPVLKLTIKASIPGIVAGPQGPHASSW